MMPFTTEEALAILQHPESDDFASSVIANKPRVGQVYLYSSDHLLLRDNAWIVDDLNWTVRGHTVLKKSRVRVVDKAYFALARGSIGLGMCRHTYCLAKKQDGYKILVHYLPCEKKSTLTDYGMRSVRSTVHPEGQVRVKIYKKNPF